MLHAINKEISLNCIYSHEETGNAITYNRDLRVGEWDNRAKYILERVYTKRSSSWIKEKRWVVKNLGRENGKTEYCHPQVLKKISPSPRAYLYLSKDLGINQKNYSDLNRR